MVIDSVPCQPCQNNADVRRSGSNMLILNPVGVDVMLVDVMLVGSRQLAIGVFVICCKTVTVLQYVYSTVW